MKAFYILAALLFLPTTASAHEWYSQRRDPVYSTTTCCGGQDCSPIPPHAISITPDGHLRVTLTVEDARRINPVRRYGFDRVIDFDRIQISEDGQPHICLMAHDMEGDPREGYYCVFLPPSG